MKIAIDSDHRGTALKQALAKHIGTIGGFEAVDLLGASQRYWAVAERMARHIGDHRFDLGILICGTGLGVAMVANKHPGVFAATCNDVASAEAMCAKNRGNLLCLGAEVVGVVEAQAVVAAWIKAWVAANQCPTPDSNTMRAVASRLSGRLVGKAALVTGGSSGIGQAVALKLALEGADVCVGYYDNHLGADRTCATAQLLGAMAYCVGADVRNEQAAAALAGFAAGHLGGIDILVNCAGIGGDCRLEAMPIDSMSRMLSTNVLGPTNCTKACLQHMQRGACVVNVGSLVSTACPGGASAYSASKAALDALTRCWAAELGPSGIRVNSVNPGPTGQPSPKKEALFQQLACRTPLQCRAAHVDEVAGAVAMLCYPEARWVTGQCLGCDGGLRG